MIFGVRSDASTIVLDGVIIVLLSKSLVAKPETKIQLGGIKRDFKVCCLGTSRNSAMPPILNSNNVVNPVTYSFSSSGLLMMYFGSRILGARASS